MNSRMLTVIGMFAISVIVGRQLFPITEVVQAQPVIPSPIELPSFPRVIEEKKSVDNIDVEVDLSTMEISVKGTTDAIVNVKTTGQPKPEVKWKTKVIEKEKIVHSGYPLLKAMIKVSEEEKTNNSPTKVLNNQKYEQ